MSDHPLPPTRGLESLKKEAKRWLAALTAGDPAARARLGAALPDAPGEPTLRDVQHALAREHRFDGWEALRRAIVGRGDADAAASLARYEEMAAALLEAYRTGTPDAMERHYQLTWHRRAWPAMRRYVQLDLGKRPTGPEDDVEITLDDARSLVAVEHGYRDWAELERDVRGAPRVSRRAAKPLRVERDSLDADEPPLLVSRDVDEIVTALGRYPGACLHAEAEMTDALLTRIAEITTITALDLSGSRALTDEGVRHLAALPALRRLDLSGTAITDGALDVLRDLPALESLSLARTAVTDAGAGALAHGRRLTTLNLAWTRTGDAALRALAAAAPGVRELHTGHLTTDAGISLLAELPTFATWQGGEVAVGLLGRDTLPNRLTLRGSFSDRGLDRLRALRGLCALDVADPSLAIGPGALRAVAELPHLAWLSLDATDEHMSHLAQLPALRFVGVQDTPAGDDGFAALARSATIEAIWGRRTERLGPRGIEAIARMPALRALAVSLERVGDAAAALAGARHLRELMPIDLPDAGYRHVARCEQLESLVLMYCRATTDAATEQIVALPALRSYFNSYTTITDRTPQLLSLLTSLERVTFDGCHGLTDVGVAALARAPRLRVLRVSGRRITAGVSEAFPPSVRVFVG